MTKDKMLIIKVQKCQQNITNFNYKEMQLEQDKSLRQIQSIFNQIKQKQKITDLRAKEFLDKIKSQFITKRIQTEGSLKLCLKIINQITTKTFNLSSKIVLDLWRLLILVQFNSFDYPQNSKNDSLQIGFSLHKLYQKVLSQKYNQFKPQQCFYEDYEMVIQVWFKFFKYTDIRTIQYAIISLFIGWSRLFSFQVQKQQINKSISALEKSCMYLIKFCQRIKQSEQFDNLILLIKSIQKRFHITFQSEIKIAIKKLKQTFKLTQTINFSNIYLNTWQKIVLLQVVCFSKRVRNEDQIDEILELFQTLRETAFVERLINFCRNYRLKKKNNTSLIISAQQLEYTLFCTIISFLINSKIMIHLISDNQNVNKVSVTKKIDQLRIILYELLKVLIKREISISMTRQLIKRLQITNPTYAIKQWKQVFSIMLLLLKAYPKNRHFIELEDDSSYISKKFSSAIKFPFSISLKLKGESIPFKEQKILIQFTDSQVREKIWITMRNYQKNIMIISFVKFVKNTVSSKEQKQFVWMQYDQNTVEITLKSNKIKMTLNNDDNTVLCIQNTLKKVDQIVLCDRQASMGSTISQIFHFKIIQYNIFQEDQKNQTDLTGLTDLKIFSSQKNVMKQNLIFHKCHRVQQNSFAHFVEALGDLQLFILILSHTSKKTKKQSQLLEMVRGVLNLMQQFTVHKQVISKQLTSVQKDQRRNSILCLCWFFAKQTKSVSLILQLMRFLYIRGKRQNIELLKFLCNFSYWRDFSLENQIIMVMKIKQILKECSKQQQKIQHLIFCKNLLFDMVLYFKQSNFMMAQKETCLKLHRTIFETIYQQVKDILQLNNRKSKNFMLNIFQFLQFLIKVVSCILNRKISEEAFDITFAIELTLFLRDIAKLIFVCKQRKNISKTDIDIGLESYYKNEQKQLIVPLSLNIQDIHEQRFNIFLTKMMSDSKSIILLFETQTNYIEESQIKVYPIYCENPISCSDNKVNSNIVSFNIYLSMLSDKSWSYILFGMPLSQYNQRFCENLWRISFYQLFKEKKYFSKTCKMLEQTPLPQNQYCLMKIFEAVLFYSIFGKQYLFRILKSQNYIKSICPFKLQNMLIKYFNKLPPQVIDSFGQKKIQQTSISVQQQKIYYILFHSVNSEYQSCKQIAQCLKYRNSYKKYNIILYHLVLKSLIKYSKLDKLVQNNIQNSQQSQVLSKNKQFLSKKQFNIPQSSIFEVSEFSQKINQKQSCVQNDVTAPKGNKKSLSEDKKNLIEASIEALNFYLSSFNAQNMRNFSQFTSQDDIQAQVLNFQINVEGMIKALSNVLINKCSNNIQRYISFIDVYVKKYSQHLIYRKFPSFKSLYEEKFNDDNIKKTRNKYLYKTVHVDLVKQSTEFFVQLMKQRRFQIHKLQQIWNQVQQKNKYFWNLFINSEKYYFLSNITTHLGERLLLSITNEKPKIQLPRMISKNSIMQSVSLISDKHEFQDQSESSTLFQDSTNFYIQGDFFRTEIQQNQNKDKQKTRKGSATITKEIKSKKFRVLLITNDKIYQGIYGYIKGFLFMTQKNIIKFEETYTSQKLYDKIGANQQQRRDDDDIERQPKCFYIMFGDSSIIYFRRYLFFDAGLEIFSYERSYFFCFDSNQKRDKFCSFYLKQNKIITYERSKKLIWQDTIKWTKGFISNYEYLMKINQYANRSINDLSQYFIMPWTIVQFENKTVDKSYIFQAENFRNLKKPLGKIFDKKWKQIQSRFQSSFGKAQSQIQGSFGMQPFLYGSFYSNPAIVTNYMIRLQPFTSLHYHLQNQKIDVADRLFFQFSDQYRSIKANISDVKQLIPQFYSNPQFLKNRARINLGSRQNKQIVNDVRLPKWTDSASEFVFKMKYFLQCPLVSKYLNYWIDLIFGVKAKRQNALAADNLYMSEIYGPKQTFENKEKDRRTSKKVQQQSVTSSILEVQNRITFNKQFGQLPFVLFDTQHPEFQMNEDYYFFKCNWENLYTITQSSYQKICQLNISCNMGLVTSSRTIDMFEGSSQDHSQKQNWKPTSSLCSTKELTCPKVISGQKLTNSSPHLFYIKKQARKLCCRLVRKAKLFGGFELKDEYQMFDAQIFNFINQQVIIAGCNNSLRIFSFQNCALTSSTGKITSIKFQDTKPGISAKQFPIFTQHKAEILFIETNQDLKLIVSIDQMNKVFLLKYNPDKIQILNNFEIKNCHFQQKIVKVLIHKMSLIVCFTSYNRLLTYSFYGDIIGAKQIGFKNQQKHKVQYPTCINFFNKQSSELLVGTNIGNIWKIDIFQFYKTDQQIQLKQLWFQKITLSTKQNEHQIKDIKVKRYGRHWQIYTVSYDQSKRKAINKAKCLTFKNVAFNLYR